jgi:excinuclease ABC subunit A
LAKALSTSAYGRNLYILDEPTSGLNDVDIDKFIQVLLLLQQNRETIIIIEHNIDFIARVSDYIIDFGLRGGNEGGKIVAQGTPKTVFDNNNSSLYNLDKQLE